MKSRLELKKVVIEEKAEAYPMCSSILRKLPSIRIEKGEPQPSVEKRGAFEMDKKTLSLLVFPGQVLKPCPGTRDYICCGYLILNIGTNCPMDCSYCVLQAYVNQPSLRVFVNLEEKLKEVGVLLDRYPERIFRIGTGEFADSLALDPIAGWSKILSAFVEQHGNAVLEFKTKTTFIQGLLSCKTRDRIIVSWSLNSPHIVAREEHGAASLKKRLEAARKCQQEGYALGFHFDPLVEHEGWKGSYLETVELLDKLIRPEGIAWISLGGLRFMPSIKPIIRKRHPGSHVLDGEFIPGLDGKMRYFKPVRIEMYRFMEEQVLRWYRDPGLYLCMESDDVWEKSLGWSPRDSQGLSRFLDRRARKVLGVAQTTVSP